MNEMAYLFAIGAFGVVVCGTIAAIKWTLANVQRQQPVPSEWERIHNRLGPHNWN